MPKIYLFGKITSVSVSYKRGMDKDTKSNLWQALSLLGQLGYVIAIPLVILAMIGRFIDNKYHTSPWFLIAGMFLALIISTFWVYKKTMEIMKNTTDENNIDDTDKDKNEKSV